MPGPARRLCGQVGSPLGSSVQRCRGHSGLAIHRRDTDLKRKPLREQREVDASLSPPGLADRRRALSATTSRHPRIAGGTWRGESSDAQHVPRFGAGRPRPPLSRSRDSARSDRPASRRSACRWTSARRSLVASLSSRHFCSSPATPSMRPSCGTCRQRRCKPAPGGVFEAPPWCRDPFSRDRVPRGLGNSISHAGIWIDYNASVVHVVGNQVTSAPHDGILLTDASGTQAIGNVVIGSGGAGIRNRRVHLFSSPTLTSNLVLENAELGIDSPVAIDGGGNRAGGNGDPLQCVGVVCSLDLSSDLAMCIDERTQCEEALDMCNATVIGANGDLNGDGKADVIDIAIFRRWIAGYPVP